MRFAGDWADAWKRVAARTGRRGFRQIPDLHFVIEGVYLGVRTLVINYRNQVGNRVCEVLTLDDGLVVEGHGTYQSADAAAAIGVLTG
jgi:hypothetical protein